MAKPYTFVDAELLTAALINANLNPEVPAAGLAATTGWVSATGWLSAGFTSTDLAVSRVGQEIYWRGTVTPTTEWGLANTDNTVIAAAAIPAIWRPTTHNIWIGASTAGVATTVFRITVNTNGALNARPSTGGSTGGMYVLTQYRKL